MSSWGKFNSNEPSKKHWNLEEAHEKLSNYCAYQERCAWDVRRKLAEKGILGEKADELIDEMVEEKFIDEERFAKSFARGKFRMKKWGRIRIIRELRMREISQSHLNLGMEEIDPAEYLDVLQSETEKKWNATREADPYKKKFKVIQYLMGKGFEQDLIKEAIENLE